MKNPQRLSICNKNVIKMLDRMLAPKIDEEKCIGCSLCPSICPEVFELGDDGKAHVKNPASCDDGTCKEAIESCPTQAITLIKK